MSKTFPSLIHVTEEGEGDDTYLVAYKDGIDSLNEPGQPVAIYQLVEVGRVNIEKSFQSTTKKRRKGNS